MRQSPRAEADFLTFARHMLASKDEDPFYPVLTWLMRDMTHEQALWLSFLFVAFCHLGSAWHAWTIQPVPGPLPHALAQLPFYTDRRGLRGGQVHRHVQSYITLLDETHGMQAPWIMRGWKASPTTNYECFWLQSQRIWGNGRWAAFKWSEILKKVHGYPLAAPDMRLQFCSGPKAGLAWLYGLGAATALDTYDWASRDVTGRVQQAGMVADVETVETLLCNWHSLVCGRYYVGCDIDAQQEEVAQPFLSVRQREQLFAAREAVLPHAYLGELRGWTGIQKPLLTRYRDTGVLHVRP